MMHHVKEELNENENFRRLESTELRREEILELIAELAQGVWLWVFLVTRDLKLAVNRDEGIDMMGKIIFQFSTNLRSNLSA